VTPPPQQAAPAVAAPQEQQAAVQPQPAASFPGETAAAWVRDALDSVDNLSGRVTDAGFWPWLSALFAFAWLISTGLWWRNRRREPRRHVAEPVKVRQANPKEALRQFRRACEANDAHAARKHLLAWAAANWPDDSPRGLDELARRLPDQAAGHLAELDRELYAPGQRGWNGGQAWQALSPLLQANKANTQHADSAALPPLYPRRS
jgi:hypothetical protein